METDSKRRSVLWAVILAGGLWGAVGVGPAPALAQKSPAVSSAAAASDQDISNIDTQRGAFDRFLDAHPEIANEVGASPVLMSNATYLRARPELQAFFDSHGPVKADPRAFLTSRVFRNEPHRTALDRLLNDLVPASVFVCFLLAFLWVLRSLWENRRWNRSFKMHEDLHAKLIEKFASGQDFSGYMQSDAGRRLLEWTPPTLDATPRGLPGALGRIFWSLQAGLVLLIVGVGLLFIRDKMAATDAPPLLVFGTLGVTLGAGFMLSALVSYGLSKHLGLIDGRGQETGALEKRA